MIIISSKIILFNEDEKLLTIISNFIWFIWRCYLWI